MYVLYPGPKKGCYCHADFIRESPHLAKLVTRLTAAPIAVTRRRPEVTTGVMAGYGSATGTTGTTGNGPIYNYPATATATATAAQLSFAQQLGIQSSRRSSGSSPAQMFLSPSLSLQQAILAHATAAAGPPPLPPQPKIFHRVKTFLSPPNNAANNSEDLEMIHRIQHLALCRRRVEQQQQLCANLLRNMNN